MASFRCILITCPQDKSDDVVQLLQGKLRLLNVVMTCQFGVATIRVHTATTGTTGLVLHHLDKLGVGVAFGEVALLEAPVVLPKARNVSLRSALRNAKTSLDFSQRLAVEEVYAGIHSAAQLSSEYFVFITCAAIIATIGLATNNPVMIVASMLVSPLMAPILAFTLATNLREWRLLRQGLLMMVLGVLLTFMVAFICGLLLSIDNYIPENNDWPTDEMLARGEYANLVLGVAYAVPSGVAVAVAYSNPNSGVLVGVAIAASLLPPCANTGLLLGYAASGQPTDGMYLDRAFISLALFAINVVCIYLAGVATFALKGMRQMVRPQLTGYRALAAVPATAAAGGGGGSAEPAEVAADELNKVKAELGDLEAADDAVLHVSSASNAAAGWRRAVGLATASSSGGTSSGGGASMLPTLPL